LITVAGDVTLQRRYYKCRHCGRTHTPWDLWAGLGEDHLSPQARRLAVLAGSSWSFDQASRRLAEFCRVRISDHIIRRVTDAAGRKAQRWQMSRAAGAGYREACGAAEFYTDGASVNTRHGWREIRLAIFAKRLPGAPATVEEWSRRSLPAPTARVASARIADSTAFGKHWARLAGRLDLQQQPVSVLADGAKWIWKQVACHLPRGECVIDIFHVSEHLHACGRVLHGDGTPAARAWAERNLRQLLQEGPLRFLGHLSELRRTHRRRAHRKALQSLANYLRPNIDGLWYAARLARGLPIGSGLVEGACKTVIGRRLKANSARWLAPRAERVASLCCLLYDDRWNALWEANAA
jgi:hypothetical protein